MQKNLPAVIINFQRALDCLEARCRQNGIMIHNTQRPKEMLLATRQKRSHIDESIFVLNYNAIALQITTGDNLGVNIDTLYTVDATEYVTAQIDATFLEGSEKWRTVS